MNYLLLVVGLILVALVTYDIIQTALSLGQGGGPLTLNLASLFWRLALRFKRFIPHAGISIVLTIVLVWVLLLWVGWSLVFAAAETSVVGATSKAPADLVGKFYFAGYTVFTLGNGDYIPTGLWRLVTVVTSASGLMLITLSITYFVPLLKAVVEKRAFAGRISLLGSGTSEIVAKLTGTGRDEMVRELSSYPHHLLLLRERHLAYPVLHYFQTRERGSAIAPNLAALSESLTLVTRGSADPDPELVAAGEKIRRATARLVEPLEPWFVTGAPDAPELPELRALEAGGVDSVGQETFSARAADDEELRRRLRWLVQDTGWSWDDT